MFFFFGWIIGAVLAGVIGSDRECGFAKAFFISLFFSPFVGLIYVFSKTKNSTLEFQKQLIESNRRSNSLVAESIARNGGSEEQVYMETIDADMADLLRLHQKGIIGEEEYYSKIAKLESDVKYQEIKARFNSRNTSGESTTLNKPLQ